MYLRFTVSTLEKNFIGKEIRLAKLITIIYPGVYRCFLNLGHRDQQQKRLTLLQSFSRIWNFNNVTYEVGPKKDPNRALTCF